MDEPGGRSVQMKNSWRKPSGSISRLAAGTVKAYIFGMKTGVKRSVNKKPQRIELGQYIVADPDICHGKPTFKGTRIMVWQVLDALARGESWPQIVAAWDGRVSEAAIAETTRLF
jgi:uncharacterized protein (DUF433 family)